MSPPLDRGEVVGEQLFNWDGADRPRNDTAKGDVSPVEQSLRGEILRVVFASDDGEYVVVRLRSGDLAEHTLVGALGGLLEGQEIEAKGRWETHKDHGRQLRVSEFRALLPTTEEGIRRYLASGLIHGIGPKYAERIVAHFGVETLTVLDNYSERLREVPGIGKKRIAEIRSAWEKQSDQRDIMVFLQGLGLTPAYCARIIARYGVASAEVVRRNPYQLAEEVHGIAFLTADRIARRLGIEAEDIKRLAAGIVYVQERLADRGHTCYPRESLLEEAAEILDVAPEHVAEGLERALLNGSVVAEVPAAEGGDPLIYLRRLWAAERELAAAVRALLRGGSEAVQVPRNALGGGFQRLNETQRQALFAAFQSGLSIITGGPGVGKTTVVGEIVGTARKMGAHVLLAAPTGRAAKRMSEATQLEAKTVHRLLRWDPASGSFQHNQERPLHCHFLILDEVSMLDVSLANDLFCAIEPGTRVLLVGDQDQLPSVGPGAVLHDLIASGRIPVTHLTEIYRQDENSRIVSNAHAVNRGDMPDLHPVPTSMLADFYWLEQDEPEHVSELIARMLTERIPKRFGLNPMRDIQVLAPMNRGNCGAVSLNERLQSALNPGPKPEFSFGDRRFRAGDRVMQTVNNYDKGVFNGELGRIAGVDRAAKTFQVAFDSAAVEYEWHEADQIRLAYAVTVHKSQGSEFPCVVVPLLTQHYMMLQRNLVYTAMTRAKKLLIMIGTRRALAIAVRNDRPMMRCTRLAWRLQHD